MKIEDLPQHLQEQARAQIAGARNKRSEVRSQRTEDTGMEVRSQESEIRSRKSATTGVRPRVPNKTESNYQRRYLAGLDARYECVTFRMGNGHRYTPDWVVFADGRPVACHECKGGYALHSQQRARLAFDQARVEFPGLVWVWAVKTPAGWQVDRGGMVEG